MSENSLVEELSMSRTPIREALQKLEHEGFLKIIRNQGILVTEMSAKRLDDLIDMRVAIETFSLKNATLLINEFDFNEIHKIIEHQKIACEENDVYKFRKKDAEFHEYLLKVTENYYFLKMFSEVYELQFTARTRASNKSEMECLITDHEKIILHIKNKEVDLAISELKNHLNSGKINPRRILLS